MALDQIFFLDVMITFLLFRRFVNNIPFADKSRFKFKNAFDIWVDIPAYPKYDTAELK